MSGVWYATDTWENEPAAFRVFHKFTLPRCGALWNRLPGLSSSGPRSSGQGLCPLSGTWAGSNSLFSGSQNPDKHLVPTWFLLGCYMVLTRCLFGFFWLLTHSYLANMWLLRGAYLFHMWLQPRSTWTLPIYLAPSWFILGSYLVSVLFYLVPTWDLPDMYLSHTWLLLYSYLALGSYLVPIILLSGSYLVPTWLLSYFYQAHPGFYLGHTWSYLGSTWWCMFVWQGVVAGLSYSLLWPCKWPRLLQYPRGICITAGPGQSVYPHTVGVCLCTCLLHSDAAKHGS